MSIQIESHASQVAAAMLPLFSLKRLPAKSIQLLLLIAAKPGANVSYLAERSGMPHSTASRLLMDLGPRNRRLKPGYGLIEAPGDASNLQQTRYYLTAKGEKLVAAMLKNMVVV